MAKEIQIQVSPETAAKADELKKFVSTHLSLSPNRIKHIQILKRSIDARQRQVKINLKLHIYFNNETIVEPQITHRNYEYVGNAPAAVIVGAGPAGYFAALKLIELGVKPIVIERGKTVRDRRRDLKKINTEHIVNPDSNYCFGEGGAGTYSDGKLYTRSKKRGDVQKILETFVYFGASHDILIDAHPHIGTNKLPKIMEDMREKILVCGGKILFEHKLTDIIIKNNRIEKIELNNSIQLETRQVILATGHSARDIFELLHKKEINIEAKPFALGVRAEHPQELIDQIQYSCDYRGEFLPPAPYSIVKQINGRGMYSFCMCPGGVIAPCATAPGEIVTNGWSPSKRNQPTANSGIVVELSLEDFAPFQKHGPLAGVELQKSIEQQAFNFGGGTQKAPAQRMVDFSNHKKSLDIPKTSYIPGTVSVELGEVFPKYITDVLRTGFKEFDKSMKGYFTNEAILHAPETRTSSPVRIPRNPITLQHTRIEGLYPCGEGAGFAGGIVSAAIDGEKCAEKCAEEINK